ncbi:MAG TPA: hydroxyisourate hydrolase [Pyrinomonadaceae bacterium]|jgi:5-hydroxyisourate hydrolase
MSAITTHILDTSRGRPASGVTVVLESQSAQGWQVLGHGVTDADGRLKELLPADFKLLAGTYRLTFQTGDYFDAQHVESFYREVTISFIVRDLAAHYHVPLLLSPFGYNTYRGS